MLIIIPFRVQLLMHYLRDVDDGVRLHISRITNKNQESEATEDCE